MDNLPCPVHVAVRILWRPFHGTYLPRILAAAILEEAQSARCSGEAMFALHSPALLGPLACRVGLSSLPLALSACVA